METGALAPKIDLPSMEERLDELADDFEMLGDWEARYRHLIDLGRSLPSLSDEERSEANKVRGCASQVWLISRTEGGRLCFRGDSDAHIVRGLIALLLGLYDARTSAEVLAFDAPAAFGRLGLVEALSRQRANGLFSMVARIRSEAQAAAAEGASSTGAS